MKKLMTLIGAAGVVAAMQAVSATPAAAQDYCHGYYGYYRVAACCPHYYRAVSAYRPVFRKAVRTVTYYRVVGYRPVAVRYYGPCCR